MQGPIPSAPMLAKSVVFFPRFLGTLPQARSPLGALALSLAMEVWVPHSSTNTRRRGSRRPTRLRQRARSSSSRSEATGDFFERQPQLLEGAADAGRRDLRPVLLVEELAMLLKREVGIARDLPRQRRLQRGALPGGRPGHGLRLHPSGLSAQPQPAPDGRLGDAEDPRNLLAGNPAVAGGQRLQPEVLRVRLHAASLARRSTYTQAAVR